MRLSGAGQDRGRSFFDLFGLRGWLELGEVERLFSEEFEINCLKPSSPGVTIVAIYLMTFSEATVRTRENLKQIKEVAGN